jgi:hypothetical protein
MAAPRKIARRVEALVEGIDPVAPAVDRARAAEHLAAYLHALGIESAPKLRWLPDLRALREARSARSGYWGSWSSFAGRQGWLFRAAFIHAGEDSFSPRAERLVELDRAVLAAGLGSAKCVDNVRWVVPQLLWAVNALRDREIAAPKRVSALVPLAEAAAAGLYAFVVLDPGVLGCVSRPLLRLDEAGRFHDWDGRPAVDWGGTGLWYWRGVQVSEQAGRNPELVNSRRILSWANAERRRVAIERVGLEAFMRDLNAELVQQDDFGKLWRTPSRINGEPYVAVEVVNATAEADGNRRRYFLRVPPETRSAREAVAWSFGMSAAAYSLAAES